MASRVQNLQQPWNSCPTACVASTQPGPIHFLNNPTQPNPSRTDIQCTECNIMEQFCVNSISLYINFVTYRTENIVKSACSKHHILRQSSSNRSGSGPPRMGPGAVMRPDSFVVCSTIECLLAYLSSLLTFPLLTDFLTYPLL